jgi:hypothetical protein
VVTVPAVVIAIVATNNRSGNRIDAFIFPKDNRCGEIGKGWMVWEEII